MKPLVISTPRTASTILTTKLFNIARDNWGYVTNLGEYFSVDRVIESNYVLKNNKIVKNVHDRVYRKWWDDKYKIQVERLELIKSYPNNMIKVHPFDLPDDIEKFIIQNYDLIFLERKNKINQFLSYLGLFSELKLSHYKTNEPQPQITSFYYSKEHLNDFIYILQCYDKFKNTYKNFLSNLHGNKLDIDYFLNKRTFIYEDEWYNASEEQLAEKLSLGISEIKNYHNESLKTKYANNDLESLIINRSEWEKDKHLLINYSDYDLKDHKLTNI